MNDTSCNKAFCIYLCVFGVVTVVSMQSLEIPYYFLIFVNFQVYCVTQCISQILFIKY